MVTFAKSRNNHFLHATFRALYSRCFARLSRTIRSALSQTPHRCRALAFQTKKRLNLNHNTGMPA